MTALHNPRTFDEEKTAQISECGLYRYKLSRLWSITKPGALFLMLNPSTADADTDDATIRRCRGYARAWDCGSFTVVNLFAYRATKPADLIAAQKRGIDIVGAKNDAILRDAIDGHSGKGDIIVAAWGDNANRPLLRARRDAVVRKLPLAETFCLTMTKCGEPGHPLMLRSDLTPVDFTPQSSALTSPHAPRDGRGAEESQMSEATVKTPKTIMANSPAGSSLRRNATESRSVKRKLKNARAVREPVVVVDLFCGAGGTSTGLHHAAKKLGVRYDLTAVNHWGVAIETHSANHPTATHYLSDVRRVNPRRAIPGGKVHLLWGSPSCVHFSRAHGGRPKHSQKRSSGRDILRWATRLDVAHIIVENVPEFVTYGPLMQKRNKETGDLEFCEDGTPWMVPDPKYKGKYFDIGVRFLRRMGYTVEWQILNSADFGDATTRKRFYLQARKTGNITWPTPTHRSPAELAAHPGAQPWRPAREIIDWTIPGKSIFGRKKPLAVNTQRRILAGLLKLGGVPFIATMRRSGTKDGQARPRGMDEPVPTVCAGGNHLALCELAVGEAFILPPEGIHRGNVARGLSAPMPTITSRGGGALIETYVLGQQSCSALRLTDDPIPTVSTAGAIALVELHAVPDTAKATLFDPEQLQDYFVRFNGGKDELERRVESIDDPMSTVDTSLRHGLCQPRWVLVSYQGNDTAHSIDEPLRTIRGKDRFALVDVAVAEKMLAEGKIVYALDIRFRMLEPHELGAAQGLPDGYVLKGNKGQKVKQIGNMVTVGAAEALIYCALKGMFA